MKTFSLQKARFAREDKGILFIAGGIFLTAAAILALLAFFGYVTLLAIALFATFGYYVVPIAVLMLVVIGYAVIFLFVFTLEGLIYC